MLLPTRCQAEDRGWKCHCTVEDAPGFGAKLDNRLWLAVWLALCHPPHLPL